MNKELKIVSWNIAGGRKDKSSAHFDYEENEDLEYFASEIKKFNPDIVCLQETHTNNNRSIAQDIATQLSIPYVFNSPASPSHIDPDYQLGNAILSKLLFEETTLTFYPDPWWDLYFKTGEKAIQHPKNLQVVKVNNVYIANTQMLPIRIFNESYEKGLGVELASKIEEVLLTLEKPIIFPGDFNFDTPHTIYPNLFAKLQLSEAFTNTVTRPDGKSKHDHIYYSPEFELIDTKVWPTVSDHYLCYAELAMK